MSHESSATGRLHWGSGPNSAEPPGWVADALEGDGKSLWRFKYCVLRRILILRGLTCVPVAGKAAGWLSKPYGCPQGVYMP